MLGEEFLWGKILSEKKKNKIVRKIFFQKKNCQKKYFVGKEIGGGGSFLKNNFVRKNFVGKKSSMRKKFLLEKNFFEKKIIWGKNCY